MKYVLKFALGIAVLLAVFFIFFRTQQSGTLDKGSLKHWLSASNDQRVATVKIAVAGDGDVDLIVKCVDKIAAQSSHEPGEMDVSTAIVLCYAGTKINENI